MKRCLEKDRDVRFGSVAELAAALRSLLPKLAPSVQTRVGHRSPHGELAHADTMATLPSAGEGSAAAGLSSAVAGQGSAQPTVVDPSRRAPTLVAKRPQHAAPRRIWPLLVAGLVGFAVAIGAVVVVSATRSDDSARQTKKKKKKRKEAGGKQTASPRGWPDKIPAKARRSITQRVKRAGKALEDGSFEEADELAAGVVEEITGQYGVARGNPPMNIGFDAEHIRVRAARGRLERHLAGMGPGSDPTNHAQTATTLLSDIVLYALQAQYWGDDRPACVLHLPVEAYIKVFDRVDALAKHEPKQASTWGMMRMNHMSTAIAHCNVLRDVKRRKKRCARRAAVQCARVRERGKRLRAELEREGHSLPPELGF